MTKLLNQLLKNIYTVGELNLITAANKAKTPKPFRTKTKSDKSALITPDIIKKLPVVVLTFATALPPAEIHRLGQWLRRNVDSQILLDVRQDPKIIGGCQIIWRGFEGDFTLRKKLQEQKAGKIRS